MRILFIGNKSSSHFIKWVDYFRSRHTVYPADTYWEARRLVHDVDIVHSHYAGRYGLYGALLNFHPFIVTIWGSDYLINKNVWWKNKLLQYQLRKADLITADTDRILKQIEGKRELVLFGVDAEKFRPNLSDEYLTPVVVTLRRQTSNLKLFKEVSTYFPTVTFEVLQDLPQEKVPYYLNKAWIYVDVSTSDAGLSMSIAEAMACGKPVVAPDHCDNAKWLSKSQLYIPNDINTLADKLEWFLKHPDRRRLLGDSNRALIVTHYNYNDEMSKMEKLYVSITKTRR